MPNSVKIDQSVAMVLRFFDFSRWRPSPSRIFAIVNFYLLTVSGRLRRITVPNCVKIGRFVAEILRFFEFSRWPPPPSWIFKIAKFYGYWGPEGRDASAPLPNFVKIGQSVAKILQFFVFFQDGGRPPSWIRLRHIWTTHSEYLGVSITLQNLVMIDAAVFII